MIGMRMGRYLTKEKMSFHQIYCPGRFYIETRTKRLTLFLVEGGSVNNTPPGIGLLEHIAKLNHCIFQNEFQKLYCFRKAVELIDNHNKSSPMFLYVAFQAAHGPITEPPKKYLDLYLDARVSRSHLNRAATVSVSTSKTELFY